MYSEINKRSFATYFSCSFFYFNRQLGFAYQIQSRFSKGPSWSYDAIFYTYHICFCSKTYNITNYMNMLIFLVTF